jgi:DNA-binding GntR family transcriptional regulator
MSEDSGSSISTIRRGLDDLVSYGVLKETKRPGHTTFYRVIEEVPLMTPEELDEFAKKNGDEIIIIKFPKS